MWVNYAQQHTGFVVGFDMNNDFWSQIGAVASAVQYITTPPKLPAGATPSVELSLLKSLDWSYEQEWRCVREFDSKESRDISFPSEVVAEVVIGSKMEAHHTARLLDTVEFRSRAAPIAVFDSRHDRDTWSFTHTPSKKQACPTCSGYGYVNR
jgi:hypothetical protein